MSYKNKHSDHSVKRDNRSNRGKSENSCDRNICESLYYKSKQMKSNSCGYVSYQKYISDPCKYRGKMVVLRNKDFEKGTVRLTNKFPTYYILGENITFSPNPDNNFKPKPDQSEYANKAYRLGFFAAITLETEAFTTIDLNRHTLESSREFSYHQRFFNLIELNNQPFIHGQGPTDFGETLSIAKNFVIKNGKLGLSSHSGIHGNGNKRGLIYKVDFKDYELAASTLNGPIDVCTIKCRAKGNRQDIAVNGPFNSALFLLEFANAGIKYGKQLGKNVEKLELSTQELQKLVDSVFSDLKVGNVITNPAANDLFGNKTGLLDGQGYGFLINCFGMAVLGFMENRENPHAGEARRVLFADCKVKDGKYNVTEVLALWDNQTNKPQTGTTGNLFAVEKVTDKDGNYVGNALSNTEVLLAQLKDQLPTELQSHFGTLNIAVDIQNWALEGQSNMKELISSGKFSIKRNGDHQFHVMKGCVGFRVDGLYDGKFLNCSVKNFENTGAPGNRTSFMGDTTYNYTNGTNGGHPDSGSQKGYDGADCYGYCFSACKNICLDVSVKNIKSANGGATGFGCQNDTIFVKGKVNSHHISGPHKCAQVYIGDDCEYLNLDINNNRDC